MARKKIVFVIVEGPSDDTALGMILNRFYSDKQVVVRIMHRDITSERNVNASNIVASVCNEVREYAKSHHFHKSDFQEIIHLTDTDGTFIPDENVIEDNTVESVCYSEKEIRTYNKVNIINRNMRKSANLEKLSACPKVWDIPYHIYYLSCNLDHVLYNCLNSSDYEKENNAYMFARKYKDQIQNFVNFISQSDFSVSGDYKETWKYIKQELHSLERHTNLGLCFSKKENADEENETSNSL